MACCRAVSQAAVHPLVSRRGWGLSVPVMGAPIAGWSTTRHDPAGPVAEADPGRPASVERGLSRRPRVGQHGIAGGDSIADRVHRVPVHLEGVDRVGLGGIEADSHRRARDEPAVGIEVHHRAQQSGAVVEPRDHIHPVAVVPRGEVLGRRSGVDDDGWHRPRWRVGRVCAVRGRIGPMTSQLHGSPISSAIEAEHPHPLRLVRSGQPSPGGRVGSARARRARPLRARVVPRALAVAFTDERVEVDGGTDPLPRVGTAGSSGAWCSCTAAGPTPTGGPTWPPRFAAEFRVLAVDLSGHGDSGHRDGYSLEQWTDEVMAVAEAGGIDGRPVVIGHSMGGFVTIATAARHADRVERRHRVRLAGHRARSRDRRLPPARGVRRARAPTSPSTTPSPTSARCRPRTTTSTTSIDHVARRSLRAGRRAAGSGSSTAGSSSSSAVGIAVDRPALPARRHVPAGPAALRVRSGDRRHRRVDVREARRVTPGHRDPRGRPPRHARPAAAAADRAADAAGRLGPLGPPPPSRLTGAARGNRAAN